MHPFIYKLLLLYKTLIVILIILLFCIDSDIGTDYRYTSINRYVGNF